MLLHVPKTWRIRVSTRQRNVPTRLLVLPKCPVYGMPWIPATLQIKLNSKSIQTGEEKKRNTQQNM